MKKFIMVLALAGLVVPATFPVTAYAEDQKKAQKTAITKKKINKADKKKIGQTPKKKLDDAPAGDKR